MTQSASMTALWHPAIRADWLVLQRTGTIAFARTLGAPALLLVCCVGVACGDFYRGFGWCLAAGVLLALGGSHAIAHKRLRAAVDRWRFGWCAALPAGRGAITSTLMLVSLGALAVSLVLITALLFGVSMNAPHRTDLAYAVAGIDLALVVGIAAAMVRAFRRGAHRYRADGVREPLLPLPWLGDPRLPHLLDWQRRAVLVRWRSGGNFILVGLVLVGVPQGPVLHEVVGLVLFALSLTWLAVAMGACADSTQSAINLLAATPFDPHRVRQAALRYPAIGTFGAAVLAAIGVALVDPSIAMWCGWLVCAVAASGWSLRRLLNATRGQGRAT